MPLRYLVRLASDFFRSKEGLLRGVRSLSASVGGSVRNPKWTSYGALEVDVFVNSRPDFDLLRAPLEVSGVLVASESATSPRRAAILTEFARRQVPVEEVTDREFDDGVLTVLGLDNAQRVGAVGDQRKQLPAREQLALAIERVLVVKQRSSALSTFCSTSSVFSRATSEISEMTRNLARSKAQLPPPP